MKITVFGCGYVGLTTAVGLAEMGNEVIGIDTDSKKIDLLQRGEMPFYEPGLKELLQRNLTEKRISFSTNQRQSIETSDLIFSAVGTPLQKGSHADLSAVLKVAKAFGQYATSGKIFINKSTVPVGTSEKIRQTIEKNQPRAAYFSVISNPEFLREGSAVEDFFEPDRIIIGLEKNDPKIRKLMKILYGPITDNGISILFTDMRSSEIIKYAANAFLATRLSFMNDFADFCDRAGGDIRQVSKGIGYDPRIGKDFLEAGIGFGGSCLPKDLSGIIEIGKKYAHDFSILRAVRNINDKRPGVFLRLLRKKIPSLRGKKIAIWGVSFKPNTDDIRRAPSLKIIDELLKQKAHISVFDPAATQNIEKLYGKKLQYGSSSYKVLQDADALLILTEWIEFHSPNFEKIRKLMRTPYIFDGRNIYDLQEVKSQGIEYFSLGRS